MTDYPRNFLLGFRTARLEEDEGPNVDTGEVDWVWKFLQTDVSSSSRTALTDQRSLGHFSTICSKEPVEAAFYCEGKVADSPLCVELAKGFWSCKIFCLDGAADC